jgi:ubiquinone/menaquinone biosynthesis C-methylase UbiE
MIPMVGSSNNNILVKVKEEDVDEYFWEYHSIKPGELNACTERHNAYEKYVRDILNFLKPSGNVLSIGCGDGVNEIYMKTLSDDIDNMIGLDLVPEKMKSLSGVCNRIHLENISGICGDGRNLPFREKCFDTVMLIEVLSHAYDMKGGFNQRVLLDASTRPLKRGGKLLILDFNNGMNPRMIMRHHRLLKGGDIENLVNPYKMTSMLKEMGFSGFGILPYTHLWGRRSKPKRLIGKYMLKSTFTGLLISTGFMLKAVKN